MKSVSQTLQSVAAWAARHARMHLSTVVVFVGVAALVVAAAGYGWWWRVVADEMRVNAIALQTMQRQIGRDLTWDSIRVDGFPYRVETTLSTLRFTAPDRGAAYDGDSIVVRVEPLALHRVTLSLEGQQHFFYAKERWIETNARADKAIVSFAGEKDKEHVSLDIERLTGKAKFDETDFNFIIKQGTGALSVTAAKEGDAAPLAGLKARFENVSLQGDLDLPLGPSIALLELDVNGRLPSGIGNANATTLLASWRNTGAPIDINKFELEWGGISVAATGTLTFDANAMPEGKFSLKLGNHRRILEILEANGWITQETRALAKPMLDVLAFVSGGSKRRITVPLTISKGDIYLGPARVGTLHPPTASAQLTTTPSDPMPVAAGQ